MNCRTGCSRGMEGIGHRLTGWDQFLAIAVEVAIPAIGVGATHRQRPGAAVLVGPQTHLQAGGDREKPIPGTFFEWLCRGIARAMLLSREQVCPGKGYPSNAVLHCPKCGWSPEAVGGWKTRKPPRAPAWGLVTLLLWGRKMDKRQKN